VTALGGPGDDGLCELIGGEVLVERGFDRTLDLLARTRVIVANDSGLLHLGGACGARAVAIFGPTHPDDGFFAWPGQVVQRDLWCRPCTLHGRDACPLGHHACMDIAVDSVLAAVRKEWACAG
jgi:heptosyltransferase-2